MTTSLTPPTGVALATPIAAGGPGGPPTGFSLPYTPVFYVVVTPNGTIATAGQPLQVFTVPAVTAGANNFFSVSWTGTPGSTLAFNAYASNCSGNALALTVSGNTLSIPTCPGTAGTPGPAQFVVALAYF
jgi:hypothetical protein